MLATKTGTDMAGGMVLPLQMFTRIEGAPLAVVGCPLGPHDPCPLVPVHCAAVMVQGAAYCRINGVPMVRFGDAASCGHVASGRDWMRIHG